MKEVTTLEETLKILKTIPEPLLVQAMIYKEAQGLEIFSNISKKEAKRIVEKIARNYFEDMDLTLLHSEIINGLWEAVEERV